MLSLNRIETVARSLGFTLKSGTTDSGRFEYLEGEIETGRGQMSFYAIPDGARIQKPNGTHKYYYGPTDGQFCRVLRQTIEANK